MGPLLTTSFQVPHVIDATRRSDKFRVSIKSMDNTRELHIARYLTERHSDRNHCVPILDVMQDPLEPNIALLVMPYLRRFNSPEFGTIDEVMEFIRQSLDASSSPSIKQHHSHCRSLTGPTFSPRVPSSPPVSEVVSHLVRTLMQCIKGHRCSQHYDGLKISIPGRSPSSQT